MNLDTKYIARLLVEKLFFEVDAEGKRLQQKRNCIKTYLKEKV